MKIVQTDNFCREHKSEVLVAENVTAAYAEPIVKALRDKYSSEHSEAWFEIKPDNYELYKFEP